MLPLDIILLVCNYVPEYVMVDWAHDILMEENPDVVLSDELFHNPHALEYIAKHKPSELPRMYHNVGIASYITIDKTMYPPFFNVFEMASFDGSQTITDALRASQNVSQQANQVVILTNSANSELVGARLLYWPILCANKGMIELLKTCVEYLDWEALHENPDGFELLMAHRHKANKYLFSKIPEVVPVLERYPKNICWDSLQDNKASAPLWQEHPEKLECVDWDRFSRNGPLEIIKKNLDKVSWTLLSQRNDVFELMCENPLRFNIRALKFLDNTSHYIPFMERLIAYLAFHNKPSVFEKCMSTFLVCKNSDNIDEILHIIEGLDYLEDIGYDLNNEENSPCSVRDYYKAILSNPNIVNFAKDPRMMEFIHSLDSSDQDILYKNPNIFIKTVNKKLVDVLLKLL